MIKDGGIGMKQVSTFVQKEFLEWIRTGKLIFMLILFCVFGIMNPAFAKLTPLLMDIMSKNLSEAGLFVREVTVNALTSWAQFYKNYPLIIITLLLMFCNTLSAEYQAGTLINVITKGMKRWKIVASKSIMILTFWTMGYWLIFGITYVYNAYFWDNNIVYDLVFSAICYYLEGIWLISLMVFMSTVFKSNSSVILSVGGIFLGVYLIGRLPKIDIYMPTYLLDSSKLLINGGSILEYRLAVVITILFVIINIVAAVICFNRKSI